jgi:hypothetical protein
LADCISGASNYVLLRQRFLACRTKIVNENLNFCDWRLIGDATSTTSMVVVVVVSLRRLE